MAVDQVRDKEGEKDAYKMDKEAIKEIIKDLIKEADEGSDKLGQMVVEVKVTIEVIVVMKMVLMEVDHAINVEGDREAVKVTNLVYKALSDEVAVHLVGLLLYRLVYHLVHNRPQHHLTLNAINTIRLFGEAWSDCWLGSSGSGVHIIKERFF